MSARDIAYALGAAQREGRNWRCNCPLHGGHSLTLADGRSGTLLVKCFGNGGNCDSNEILAELRRRKLLPQPEPRRNLLNIVATYDYRDADGALLFQVCRLDPKTFRQGQPNGTWNIKNISRVLYRLPELVAGRAATDGQPPRIYICEGEKDVDRLRHQWGLSATCNPGGAGKWRCEFDQYLTGFDVVILPDNDVAGRGHAQQVARSLALIAASVRILELPGLPEGGDVSDWLDRNPDSTQTDFETLVECTSIYRPNPTVQNDTGVVLQSGDQSTMEKLHWLWPGWLARGKFHLLAGTKGAGKSTILFDVMARLTTSADWPDGAPGGPPGDVLMWSGEDDIRDTILLRFVAAGGNRNRIFFAKATRINGVERPFDPSTDIELLIAQAADLPELLFVMIDPIVLALPTQADSHKNAETRRGLQPLVDFAEQRAISLVGVHHFPNTPRIATPSSASMARSPLALYRGASGAPAPMMTAGNAASCASPPISDPRVAVSNTRCFKPHCPATTISLPNGSTGAGS